MMTKKFKITKNIIVPVMAVLIAGVGIGSTAAYFRYWQSTKNALSVGENTIKITEDFAPPKEMTVGENTYKKNVAIKNTGTIPCYVRVYAGFSDSAVEDVSQLYNGTEYVDAGSYKDNLPDKWAYVEEADDSIVGDGGYYYYTEVLAPGKTTDPLFTNVKTTFATADDVQDYEIIVYAESVQTLDKDGAEFTGNTPWKSAWREFLERR